MPLNFKNIDAGIEKFIEDKDIEVLTDSKSDWLVFERRQLLWKKNNLNYLIEIYPEFDSNENIKDWTLYTAVYYDSNRKRYLLKKIIMKEVPLEQIEKNIISLLTESYEYISKIKKEDIPCVISMTGD